MGRKAGVSAGQTRSDVLQAAARVFARRGYEGATIAEIAGEAGLSSGSIYGHFAGKAGLFSAVLEAYGRPQLARRLHDDRPFDIADYLADAGADLDRPVAERTLLIEAVMAAKQDPQLRQVLSRWFADQQEFFSTALAAAQAAGRMDPGFSPAGAARLATTVVLGSLVLDVLELPSTEEGDWADAVRRVVDAFRIGDRSRAGS
jgi:AcrR family transcriptional regulator